MIANIRESLQIPYEGIFWYINNELIAFTDTINTKDTFDCTDLLHKEVWKEIRNNYLVNGNIVSYDYFPRGRVETLVILDSSGNLDCYEANVYLDKCINKKTIRDQIEEEFRLYLKNVNVNYAGQLFIDGSHYVCHKCCSPYT